MSILEDLKEDLYQPIYRNFIRPLEEAGIPLKGLAIALVLTFIIIFSIGMMVEIEINDTQPPVDQNPNEGYKTQCINTTENFTLTGTIQRENGNVLNISYTDPPQNFEIWLDKGEVTRRSGFRKTGPSNYTVTNQPQTSSWVHVEGAFHNVNNSKYEIASLPESNASVDYESQDGTIFREVILFGDYDKFTLKSKCQNIHFVVPGNYNLTKDDIRVQQFVNGTRSLEIGPRNKDITVMLAPGWAEKKGGGMSDDNLIIANETPDESNEIFEKAYREYVTVRQRFKTSSEAKWFKESVSQYFTWEFEEKHTDKEYNQTELFIIASNSSEDVNISNPSTWRDDQEVAKKGGYAISEVALEVQNASGDKNISIVLRRFNGEERSIDAGKLNKVVQNMTGEDEQSSGIIQRVTNGTLPSPSQRKSGSGGTDDPTDGPNTGIGSADIELRDLDIPFISLSGIVTYQTLHIFALSQLLTMLFAKLSVIGYITYWYINKRD